MKKERLTEALQRKIDRISAGHAPRVLDLFAGCGGISLGFQAEGYSIEAAVELDPTAAATHSLNFHGGDKRHARPRDITKIEPQELADELGLGPVEDAFDIVVGGPPCQAYARVGRAKLRDVAEHPEAFKVDPRGNLYLRYLQYVRAAQPLAVLVENVPDVLNYGGHNVMGEIAEVLDGLGYEARYSLVNTAFHGVPQLRDRVFLIAVHRCLKTRVSFPNAERHLVLSQGYEGTRAVALKHISKQDGGAFVAADLGDESLRPPVTAFEALGDLPPITLHLEGLLKRGARKLDQLVPYGAGGTISQYAVLMRSWPGFEANEAGLIDHVIRYLPRDTDIFKEMPNGGEYPAAHATAVALYERQVKKLERQRAKRLDEQEREQLRRAMVPPYPVHNFPNRWWKLRSDRPSRTLLAHIGKDTYSHIHYDSAQARVISVREAARLQSFPDGFIFAGAMNAAYKQIGNAVPPLMARRLAAHIRSIIDDALATAPHTIAAE
ncbi:DNA cytosine methyltransferase [Rhizobium laguerreae]